MHEQNDCVASCIRAFAERQTQVYISAQWNGVQAIYVKLEIKRSVCSVERLQFIFKCFWLSFKLNSLNWDIINISQSDLRHAALSVVAAFNPRSDMLMNHHHFQCNKQLKLTRLSVLGAYRSAPVRIACPRGKLRAHFIEVALCRRRRRRCCRRRSQSQSDTFEKLNINSHVGGLWCVHRPSVCTPLMCSTRRCHQHKFQTTLGPSSQCISDESRIATQSSVRIKCQDKRQRWATLPHTDTQTTTYFDRGNLA